MLSVEKKTPKRYMCNIIHCNITVLFRCSNKDHNETDRNCSTSPAPSHSCDTINEESEETTTEANTSRADDQTQKQVCVGDITFDVKSSKIRERDSLNGGDVSIFRKTSRIKSFKIS